MPKVLQNKASPSVSESEITALIEAAMNKAHRSSDNAQTITAQLAAELVAAGAALSEVRMATYALYEGNRTDAEAYLAYLSEQGFPPVSGPTRTAKAQQRAAIACKPNTYGQLAAKDTEVSLYGGNLITELVANSAFSALIFGERRSGTSAILRGIAYDQIDKSSQLLLDILDLHSGEWGGLEHVRLEDSSRLVSDFSLHAYADIEALSQKLLVLANEVKRRQHQQRQRSLALSSSRSLTPYLILIDGLSELHGALPGWSADRRSKDPLLSESASSLRFLLCHGPAVGISCVATARDHSRCFCDATALAETKLLFLGRISAGGNGGYRAIARAIEDKDLLPAGHERSRYRDLLSAAKSCACPVVFTPNGIPRLGRLADFSGYLRSDLLAHYQHSIERAQGRKEQQKKKKGASV